MLPHASAKDFTLAATEILLMPSHSAITKTVIPSGVEVGNIISTSEMAGEITWREHQIDQVNSRNGIFIVKYTKNSQNQPGYLIQNKNKTKQNCFTSTVVEECKGPFQEHPGNPLRRGRYICKCSVQAGKGICGRYDTAPTAQCPNQALKNGNPNNSLNRTG